MSAEPTITSAKLTKRIRSRLGSVCNSCGTRATQRLSAPVIGADRYVYAQLCCDDRACFDHVKLVLQLWWEKEHRALSAANQQRKAS